MDVRRRGKGLTRKDGQAEGLIRGTWSAKMFK